MGKAGKEERLREEAAAGATPGSIPTEGKPQPPPVEPTQGDVDGSLASGRIAARQPATPDSAKLRAGNALLGRGARINIARRLTVILSNYDVNRDDYWGMIVNSNKAEAGSPFKNGDFVSGLKRYPYTERMNYPFQFVLPGEDEAVLIDVENASFRVSHDGVVEVVEEVTGGSGTV